MGTTSIGSCGVLFGVCGCLDQDVCLEVVSQFQASHQWHGYTGWDCSLYPELTPAIAITCESTQYTISSPTHYLVSASETHLTAYEGSTGNTYECRRVDTTTVNRYTGYTATSWRLYNIQGTYAQALQLWDSFQSPGWIETEGSHVDLPCSETGFGYTKDYWEWSGSGSTLHEETTVALSIPFTILDFMSDCEALYDSVTLDDLNADFSANGMRGVTARYIASGTIVKEWVTAESSASFQLGLTACNYFEFNTQLGNAFRWRGIKTLMQFIECVSEWRNKSKRWTYDVCANTNTLLSTSSTPTGSIGDTVGIEEDVNCIKRFENT